MKRKSLPRLIKVMKFGKFYDKAKEAKDRLRPGEVKKLVDGKWVSNKD